MTRISRRFLLPLLVAVFSFGGVACGGGGGGTAAPARVLYRCECGKTERVDAGYAAPTCACGKTMAR